MQGQSPRPAGAGQRIASGGRLAVGAVALAFGLLAIGIYAAQTAAEWTVFASAVMLAGAALLAGGSLGFLFGVPRTLSGDRRPDATSDGLPTYGANTNLEQISDWLTKILVGIGIAQFGAIRRGASRLFATLAPSLGGLPTSATFAGALLVYFGLLGFLAGWLLTRLFLAPALSAADRRVLQTLVAADVADAQGDPERATELRQEALDLLQAAAPTATAYERLRATTPSGPARTRAMEGLVAEARRHAEEGSYRPEQVRELFDQGDEGSRVYALGLMQGDPRVADLGAILDGIEDSRSAFEQYHALQAARMAAPHLDGPQRGRLLGAIRQQRERGWVRPGTDRWAVSQAILDGESRQPQGERSGGSRASGPQEPPPEGPDSHRRG